MAETSRDSLLLYEEIAAAIRTRHLATRLGPALVAFTQDFDQAAAAKQLDRHDFDFAPVTRRDRIVGRVRRKTLGVTGAVGSVMEPLAQDMLISADAPIRRLMRELKRDPFLFVVDVGGIEGIVTPSDFNKESARAYMFLLITDFEIRLASAVRAAFADQDAILDRLPQRDRLIVTRRFQKQRRQGVAADYVACMSLSVLISAVKDEPKVSAEFGHEDALKFRELARRVAVLRNEIDHATSDLVRARRDLDRLIKLEDLIRGLLTNKRR